MVLFFTDQPSLLAPNIQVRHEAIINMTNLSKPPSPTISTEMKKEKPKLHLDCWYNAYLHVFFLWTWLILLVILQQEYALFLSYFF